MHLGILFYTPHISTSVIRQFWFNTPPNLGSRLPRLKQCNAHKNLVLNQTIL
jgi:hypothetical protein